MWCIDPTDRQDESPEEGIIDLDVLNQIRDMDEEDEEEEEGDGRSFSRGIVWGYFEQAESTFEKMEEAM
jgi:osomolarity two-component system phosphorelay intermediate protein YPD1